MKTTQGALASVFKFQSNEIRTLVIDSQPWFNANDVCEVLEYANPHDAIANHVYEDDLAKIEVIDYLGRPQKTNHINESGLYALIFGSKKESAKTFKRWVISEVLPSIRETGKYSVKPNSSVSNVKKTNIFPDKVKAEFLEMILFFNDLHPDLSGPAQRRLVNEVIEIFTERLEEILSN